jgi:hypothetical protein
VRAAVTSPCSVGLARNALSTWPLDLVAGFASLVELRLSHNALAEVPPHALSAPPLSSVRLLDLSHNPLQHLPTHLGALTALTSLRVASCGLSTLPLSLRRLERLRVVDATGNRLPGVLADAADAIVTVPGGGSHHAGSSSHPMPLLAVLAAGECVATAVCAGRVIYHPLTAVVVLCCDVLCCDVL